MNAIKEIATGRVINTRDNPVWIDGIWQCGNISFSDIDKTVYAPVTTSVSVTKFKLLFTSAERIAIAAAKATDPVIADFYSILDDPRTTEVDLSLQSVQGMLDYLIGKTLITAARKAAILTGQLV